MAGRDVGSILDRVRQWPERRQNDLAEIILEIERQDTSRNCLTDAQAKEVARTLRDIRERSYVYATDEQMAALWKSCGL
jgi:hypothetical protein